MGPVQVLKILGGGNEGSLTDFANWRSDIDCIYKNCLDFNGSSNVITLNNTITLSNVLTVSAWVYRDTNSTYDFVTGSITSKGNKFGLSSGKNKIFLRVLDYPASSDTNSSDDVVLAQWTFIAFTRNSSDKIDLYVNNGGAKRAFSDAAQTGDFIIKRLGSDEGSNYMDGRLNEIRVYDRALSSFQIRNLYLVGLDNLLASGAINKNEYSQRIADLNLNYAEN